MEYEVNENLNRIWYKLSEDIVPYFVAQEKDKSFKSLFEVKRQFIQLIKTFVKEKWTEDLIDENIELADKEFVMLNMHGSRADTVYRIKTKDQEIYFVLLEFQSTVDSKMQYRLLSYILEIWRKYEKDSKLPMVIPCVLYTGSESWNVKTLKNLFDVNNELEKYIPDFEYILIDVNKYTDEELIETANLVSSVMYMSKAKNKNEVIEKLKNVIDLVSKLNKRDQDSFIKWTEGMFYKYENAVYDYFEQNLKKEEGNGVTFEEKFVGALDLIKDRGVAEGMKEAKLQSVLKILPKKLKQELPESVKELINNAALEKLEEIEDKIFEIDSLDEVKMILL